MASEPTRAMTAPAMTPEERARAFRKLHLLNVALGAGGGTESPLKEACDLAEAAMADAIRAAVDEEREAGSSDLKTIMQALDERDMFLNPDTLDRAADEIDCSLCEYAWTEWDTNASGCSASERGDYCPNDVAETLRALAKVSRKLEIGLDETGRVRSKSPTPAGKGKG